MSTSYPFPIIQVDRREDTTNLSSRGTDMLKLLLSHRLSPQAISTTLTAGDFCFPGQGPDNTPVLIGIERKRLRDMMNSIRSGRYSGEQLPKLLKHYDYVYLILEARYKSDWNTGYLMHKWARNWEPFSFSTRSTTPVYALELSSFLASITTHTPVKLIHTEDERGTIEAILSLAHSWSKPWDKHHAHIAIHQPDQYINEKASTLRRVAFAIRDIGWERSRTVEEHFSSVEDMVTAPVSRWEKLPGFGKVLSKKVWNQLHGIHVGSDEE